MNGAADIDELLVKRAQKGDMDAFETLVTKYEKKVFSISFRMLSDREEAMDASQEVFIKVFKALSGFKSESKFSTWLYRITTNVCLDLLRKRKDNSAISFDAEVETEDGEMRLDPVDRTPGVEETIEREELKRLVSEAVMKLPEIHRTMIILRDFNDLSYSEIASAIDCPEGTIKSRISRARKALKDLMLGSRELKGYFSV